jgi:hypothetical protein
VREPDAHLGVDLQVGIEIDVAERAIQAARRRRRAA